MTSLNSSLKICFSFFLVSLLTYNLTASLENLESTVTEEPAVCKNINCGQGKCVASNLTILGYECQCSEGWKKLETVLFPGSCTIPNCSISFGCGKGGSSSPSFAGVSLLNFTSPCNLVWCNNGDCVVNGTGHYCQCQDENENLFDNNAFACFPQCALGADCKKVTLGSPPAPTQGSSDTISLKYKFAPLIKATVLDGTNTAESGEKKPETPGSNGATLRPFQAFSIMLLSAILQAWI